MPGRAGAEQRHYAPEETLRMIRETGLASFRLRLFRTVIAGSPPVLLARFETATYGDFEHASAWVHELCGGGVYFLEASRTWDSRYEPDLVRPIGSFVLLHVDGAPRDVNLTAPSLLQWRGPLEMTYPTPGATIDAVPHENRVPALKEPLQAITVGWNPDVGSLMFDGKAGGFPSNYGAGYFDRLYLFGEPVDAAVRVEMALYDFSFGISQTRSSMPGVRVQVNGRASGHFSMEIIKACSQGPTVEASLLEVQGKILTTVRREETDDLMVQIFMALDRLKKMPLVGYALYPVIGFSPTDDIRIDGVPRGMRMYLTGVIEKSNGR